MIHLKFMPDRNFIKEEIQSFIFLYENKIKQKQANTQVDNKLNRRNISSSTYEQNDLIQG